MAKAIPKPDMQRIADKANLTSGELQQFIALVQRGMVPEERQFEVCEKGNRCVYTVRRCGLGVLNTRFGKLWQYSFLIDDRWGRYTALVKAELDEENLLPVFEQENLLVRTDSGCETGQVYGDLTCDCKEQLELAMQKICEAGEGVIVCIPTQDGRGMGVPFKLATLWLQDTLGVNTVESAGLLAEDGIIDARTYGGVVAVLKFFGISTDRGINLATNNPDKVGVFGENGYSVVDQTPVVIPPTTNTRQHLAAKQEYLGHTGLVS